MNYNIDKLGKNNSFKTKVKSRNSIVSNASNNSRKSNKNNSKIISLINPPINKSNGKIMINNLHNNINKNDSLYDNLLFIEGKRIINKLSESIQITNDGKYIINSKKILYNDDEKLLNNLFTKNNYIFFENKPTIKENQFNNGIYNFTHRNSINKKSITQKILSPNNNDKSISFSKSNKVHKKSKSYNKKEEIISQILNTVKINKENEHKKENLYKNFNSHRTSKTFSSNSILKN
jgi:hypothetical protein